jgi:hemolysin activation/secretion protein
VVKLESTPPLEFTVATDNAGSRATGASRVIANLQGKSLLERGELQTLQVTTAQGLQALRWSYSEPLGSTGLRGGMYLSNARYHLVLPEFSAINARGPSNVRGLELNYPWLRRPNGSLNLQASLEQKHFHNEAADVVVSRYKSDLLNVGVSGQVRDEWVGGGMNSVSLQSTAGRLDLTGSANQASDAQTTQTDGSFRKLRLQVMRQQKLLDQDVLQVSAQGQWANKNLDGSEKFFLGGPQGVRAYPVNEAGGSEGRLFSVEWQHPFLGADQQRYTISAFADKGQIRQNKYSAYAGAPALNDYSLRGYGLWLGTQIPWSLGETQLRLTWSRRLGSNPNGFTPQQDQDGSQVIQRLWFFANHLF